MSKGGWVGGELFFLLLPRPPFRPSFFFPGPPAFSCCDVVVHREEE